MPYTSNVSLPSAISESHTSAAERRVDETLARLPELDEPIVLSIEGNIGAGKTTFLDVLMQYFGEENIELVHEPVEQWKNIEGNNMLEVRSQPPTPTPSFASLAVKFSLCLSNHF
jgi:ABC-type hemin transport system ATPase subunit